MDKIKLILILLLVFTSMLNVYGQTTKPCAQAQFRVFDFWIGEWEVYKNNTNQKAGDSKISPILDSCVILEEWSSLTNPKGFQYAGKSFNTYNAASGQYQQTWVDNTGSSIEFLKGKYYNDTMHFETFPFKFSNDTMAIRRLRFIHKGIDKVQQFGEISKDNGLNWSTEYDLEYRRIKG